MRVLFTGGGTGGHIYPALAAAKQLLERDAHNEILFVGTKKGLEHDIVPKEGFAFETITVEGLPRRMSLQFLRTFWKLGKGLLEARQIIKRFKPEVVVATGGYVAGPVAAVASWKNIPVLVHEQNAFPGITNRLLAKWAMCIALTYPETSKYFPEGKTVVTGNPVRPEIVLANKQQALAKLGLAADKKTLLVFGGSRGATSINQAVVAIRAQLQQEENLQVIHVTGSHDFAWVSGAEEGIQAVKKGNISIKSYLYDMPNALAAADLVVCRAGATTLAEITVRGLPALLIPYPYASDNHQEYNARTLERAGAALVLLDKDLQGELFAKSLFNLIRNDEKRISMGENSKLLGCVTAAEKLVAHIYQLADRT